MNLTTHIKPLTYSPKIVRVLSGECCQTIRPIRKRPVKVGDRILFHGWTGRPYRSPWSWRLKVEVTETTTTQFSERGQEYPYDSQVYCRWSDMNDLAARDGIEPPTGEELHRVLGSMHKLGIRADSNFFQIIRWKPPTQQAVSASSPLGNSSGQPEAL